MTFRGVLLAAVLIVSQKMALGQSEQPKPVSPTRAELAAQYIAEHTDREEMTRIPMRDGVQLMGTLLFPKGRPRSGLPLVLVHQPYQIDGVIQGFAPFFQSFLSNGYAILVDNSRGRYFSGGTYSYLTGSGHDGYDIIDWAAKQPWSNGKVGTFGCSSSAEEQHKMNAMHHPAHAAAVPMGSGAGIGKVGAYNEMGNFYRGGVFQSFWFLWYYGAGYKYRPSFPPQLSREELLRLAPFWTLERDKVPDPKYVEELYDKAVWTLPVNQIGRAIGAPPSDIDDFINWPLNDPRWRSIEFGGEGDRSGAPTLYVNSWYDLSIGPNTAMFEYQSKNAATKAARDNTFMVIAPTSHCDMGKMESEHTIVGERDMGDARFDYIQLVQRWFDRWLKGIDNGVAREPKVRAYVMGENRWRAYDSWPPKGSKTVKYYLDSGGKANGKDGDGQLAATWPRGAGSDSFTYDPANPVPSAGGVLAGVMGGALDQSKTESNPGVLVYTSASLKKPLTITGPIKVSLYLSSDVKDTDLFVTLVDVYPDGRAFNLDRGALRVRWREGYDKPVLMTSGQVYRVEIPPLVTSNSFGVGHRIRLDVTSSLFPQFERNLNTGGNNFDEREGMIAHNVIHHDAGHASFIEVTVPASGANNGT
jgi:putative CocE/NonD family hydrolase